MSKYRMRSAVVVSLMAVVFALALPAQARKDVIKYKSSQYSGTIESIDTAAGTVTVKNPDGETKTFICDAACKITPSTSWHGTLSDLNVSDDATAVYIEKDGKLVCRHLVARKPAPPAPKQEAVKAEVTVAPPAVTYHQFKGRIMSIDAATRTVTISKEPQGFSTVTVTCAADCKFRIFNNDQVTLSDLPVGDPVTAGCTEENGKFVCHLLADERPNP
jgi:hypothetical protein